jgi:hypothetical protein
MFEVGVPLAFVLHGKTVCDECDTPSVTVSTIVFYSTFAVQSTMYLGLSSLSKLNLSFKYY